MYSKQLVLSRQAYPDLNPTYDTYQLCFLTPLHQFAYL